MKKIIILIVACFVSVHLFAQGKSKRITIKKQQVTLLDWMAPLTDLDLELMNSKLPIKLRLVSPEKINRTSMFITINGKRMTSTKAGEVSLVGTPKNQEYTLGSAVHLLEGNNKIQVTYELMNGQKIRSPIKEIEYQNSKATIGVTTKNGEGEMENYIYWLSPNTTLLNNKPLTEKKREFPVALKILASRSISKEDIVVFHNDNILVPSPRSSLKKVSLGEYIFKDFLQLTEAPKQNVIDVQFRINGRVCRTKAALNVEFSPVKGNLYVLSIGTSTDLEFTKTDAWDFAELYTNQAGSEKLFNRTIVEVLPGKEASASAIKENIEGLKTKFDRGVITSADMIILFLSSHGFLYDSKEFRIQGDDYDSGKPKSTSVSYKVDILDILDRIPCKKLIFIDACHSGAAGARGSNSLNFEIEKLNKIRNGLAVIASSRGNEKSYEDEKWENGAFTEAILLGLQDGKADLETGNKDGIISLLELSRYINKTVPKMVGEVKSQAQHPILLSNSLSDIAIYVPKK